jgi:hypothetical protein
MEPSFTNIDEIEAFIYQTSPQELEFLSQVNSEIYKLLNTKKVLNKLTEIHELENKPESFEEFMTWVKCKTHSFLDCIYNAILKGHINLLSHIYDNLMENQSLDDIDSKTKIPLWVLIIIWALEVGNNNILAYTLKPYIDTSGSDSIVNNLENIIYNLAHRGDSLTLLLRLLDFYQLDLDNFNVLYFYIDAIVNNSNKAISDLEILETYLTKSDLLTVNNFYNIVADTASTINAIDILLWSLDKGANNYLQILNNLLNISNYFMIHQILSQYEDLLSIDDVDSFILDLVLHMAYGGIDPWFTSDSDLKSLLKYIQGKWNDTYHNLIIEHFDFENNSDDKYGYHSGW